MVDISEKSLAARIADLEYGPRSLKEDYTLAAYKMLLATMDAEPAPVAPDEVTYAQAENLSGWESCSDAWADGWNACRAAMLNQK